MLTKEVSDQMKLMNTTVNQMGAFSEQFKRQEQKIDQFDQKLDQKFDK